MITQNKGKLVRELIEGCDDGDKINKSNVDS